MYSDIQKESKIKATWLLIILLFPLMLPDYLQHLGVITDIFTLFTGIILVYLFVLTFLYKEFNSIVVATIIFSYGDLSQVIIFPMEYWI